MHSQEITDTFRIFKASEAAKAHALLTADIDPATVPACYGGTLGGFTRQMRDEIGLDSLPPSLLAAQFQAPPEHLGGFHMPPPPPEPP